MGDISLSDFSREAVQAVKGTVLMRQGELGRCAYFVVQGRLLVEKEVENDRIAIAEIGPNDIVGELAILDDAPRSATVTVLEDSLLIQLDKLRIKAIIRRSPTVAEVIMKLLCSKLRQNHEKLMHATDLQNPAYWRKICSILRLCHRGGLGPEPLFVAFLEHCQLLVGIPANRLREILARLEEAKIVRCEGMQISHVDADKLEVFIAHSTEEYGHEEFPTPTAAKVYETVQTILNYCKPPTPETQFLDVPLQHLYSMVMASGLWKNLRPALQQQRAESVLNQLFTLRVLEANPAKKDYARLNLSVIHTMPTPYEEITNYEGIKMTLFKQPVGT